jgi:two-component sensor histidine kinase
MSTILLVDDDKRVIHQVTELLQQPHYTTRFLLEPAYLFQFLETVPVDLLLLDIHMPEVDGLEVLRQLKAHDQFSNLPVIMLTADENETILSRCFSSGARDFISKPIQTEILRARVSAALEVQQHIKKLEAAVTEKEVLLKEIHHRVKNNLQVISSLFRLQAATCTDDGLLNLLRDSQSRIESMAMIHERIYRSDTLSRIRFDLYVQDLIQEIFQSYRRDHFQPIRLQLELEALLLGIDMAIPCALILNELVSNTLKYAFPQGEQGTLQVRLHTGERGKELHIRVRDDGVGLPEGFDVQRANSLGLRLVNILTRQLQGSLTWHCDQGTCFEFVLPVR